MRYCGVWSGEYRWRWRPLRGITAGEPSGPPVVALSVQSRDRNGKAVRQTVNVDPRKTAVVVIDMWDRHWCATYTARVGNLTPRMNQALEAARKLGIQVVFAPSDVVEFYKDSPQRKAMQSVPAHFEPPRVPLAAPASPGPTDHCECGPDEPCKAKAGRVWTRQRAELKIAASDLIGDCNNGRELWNLCAQRGIDTLIYRQYIPWPLSLTGNRDNLP